MTFLELQEAVLADRFDESQRGDVKNWINDCYDTLVGMAEWTFNLTSTNVSVTSGSIFVGGIPAHAGAVRGLYRSDGTPLNYLTPEVYASLYFGQTSTGLPSDYTVIATTEALSINVGPVSSETSSTYDLLFEQQVTALTADGSTPSLPVVTHMALVYGAAATGLALAQDYEGAAVMQERFDRRYQAMRNRYLTASRVKQSQSPAYRPY